MERPKQLNIFKRHRGRGYGEKKPRPQTRETRVQFWRRSSGKKYLDNHKGVAARKRHKKARAKAKRGRASRKRNR